MLGAPSRSGRCLHSFYVVEYLEKAGFQPNQPLFQSFRKKKPTGRAMSRSEPYRMIRRRAVDAGILAPICCHSGGGGLFVKPDCRTAEYVRQAWSRRSGSILQIGIWLSAAMQTATMTSLRSAGVTRIAPGLPREPVRSV